jgi:hypothetical protein
MKKIYVAGKYSADNIIDVLKNIREGIKISAKILKFGHIPFSPFLDHQFLFYEDLTVKELRKYSIEWLKVCDILFVLPNSEKSKGTQEEIKIAQKMGIPIVYKLNELTIL